MRQALLQALLPNLEHSQASMRRAGSQAMMALVAHCRRPELFLPWLLSALLGTPHAEASYFGSARLSGGLSECM